MAVVKLTAENFEQEVLKSDKPVLVDFYADWCGPCKMMAPVIEQISNEETEIKVGKINIDENIEIAQKYKVMSIPMFIAFKNGDSVITHRIVDKVEEEGKIKYKTKGDNNNATDDWYVSPEQIEGIYQFKMSKLGNIAMFIQTPIGMIICLSIPIILIILTQMTASKEKQKDMEQEIEKLKKQNKELTQSNK